MSNALSVSITWDASHFSDNAWSMIVGPARPGVTVSTEAKPWRRARSSGSESGVGGCACKMVTARSAAHDANSCGWRMTISETACTAPSAASAISISVCRVDASPERACLKAPMHSRKVCGFGSDAIRASVKLAGSRERSVASSSLSISYGTSSSSE